MTAKRNARSDSEQKSFTTEGTESHREPQRNQNQFLWISLWLSVPSVVNPLDLLQTVPNCRSPASPKPGTM